MLAVLLGCLVAPAARAADLIWDTIAGDGSAITEGSGNWNSTDPLNTVWNDGTTPNVAWSQTDTITPLNSATFAGADGTADQYVVTLGAPMAAQFITFNSAGYKITGSTLSLMPSTTVNGIVTVAAGKTATLNSTLRYNHNRPATVTVGSGGFLNLGGGTTTSFNPQLTLTGEGTINITAGTYQTTIGNRNAAIIDHTGGTWTMSDQGTNLTTSIGNGAGRNVIYTVSGTATLNVLANNTSTTTYTLSLGRNMGAFQSTLTLKSGGTVNIGVTANRAGQINLGSFDANGNSLLDVQGGTLTVGTGKSDNKLYFFAAGANAGKTATMTQSGGTATLNGIQFGANAGDNAGGVIGANSYAADSSAKLQLSGGTLYVGALGIARGSAAAALPVTIQLLGGTLGASADWSSALHMKLGTTGGGVTVHAANSGGIARNITLSGVLSDDGAVNGPLAKTGSGTLTLSGANTYTGPTTVGAGELRFSTAGSATTDITVAESAAAGVIVASADGEWVNAGSLAYSNNSSMHIDFGVVSPSMTVAPMRVAGLSLGTGLTMRVDGLVSGLMPSQTYPLATWTGSGPADASAFSTVILPGGISGTLGVSGSTLSLTVTGNTSLLAWNTGDGAWDTGTFPWVDSSLAAAAYVDTLNAVMFGDAAGVTGNPTVTLDSTFSPLGVVMRSTNHNYTINGTGTIAGSAGLTLDPSNTRTLTLINASNTFSGTTTIGGGMLQLGGTCTLGGGNHAGVISIAGGATFENAGAGSQTLSGPVTGGGTLKLSSGQFILTSSGNGYGALNITGVGRIFINTSANALPAAATASIANGGLLVFGVGTSYGNSITIEDNGGLCTRVAAGTVLGNVTLPGTGTVIFNNDDATTRALTITNDQTLTGSLTLQIGGGRMTIGTAVLGGVTLSGALAGGGGLIMTSAGNPGNTNGLYGSGVLTLTGANSYTGATAVSSGILNLGNPLALRDSALDTLNSAAGGTVTGLRTAVTTLTMGGLIGNKALADVFTTSSGGFGGVTDLALNPGTNALHSYSGAIADGAAGMSLTMIGEGTQVLAGANTYTGPTTVSNGTLLVDGSIGAGAVTVCSGATLGGTGTVSGAVSVENDGVLSPGASPGTLTLGNGLTLAANSRMDFDLGTNSDRLEVGGALALDGKLRITDSGGFGPGSHKLIRYTGTLSGALPSIESAPGGYDYTVDTNTAGEVQLVVTSAGGLTPFQQWQILFFGSTNALNGGATDDWDGDGSNNGSEFGANTNPTNALSVLKLTQAVRNGTDLLLTWTAAGVRTNRVQVGTNLTTTNFVDLSGPIVLSAPDDTTTNYLDAGGATNAQPRFYRIRVEALAP